MLIITKIMNKEKQMSTGFLFDIQLKLISEILNKDIKDIINIDNGMWGSNLKDSIELPPKLIRSTPANTKYDTNNK